MTMVTERPGNLMLFFGMVAAGGVASAAVRAEAALLRDGAG